MQTWLRRLSVLILPSCIAVGAATGWWSRGPSYDTWTWLGIGGFNGLVVGATTAVILRVASAYTGCTVEHRSDAELGAASDTPLKTTGRR